MRKIILTFVLFGLVAIASGYEPQRKEYLTEEEQDLIREAALDPVARIKLFLKFAADRWQKFQAALAAPETKDRSATLNDLLGAYTSCIDDMTDTFDLHLGRRVNLRKAIVAARAQLPAFLAQLEEFKKTDSPDANLVRDTLEDAILATQEAIEQVDKATKEQPPEDKPKKGDKKN